MDLGLRGRRALVTASTAGIGLAIARSLAAEGATVWVNGRTRERVDAAVGEIGGDVRGVAADLSTAEGCEGLFAAVEDVDVVVNNLGLYTTGPFLETSDEQWLSTLQTNVLSGVRVTRRYLPGMLGRGWGRVLFVSSDSGVQVPADSVHYGVSKAAVLALARGVAESVPGSGVTVNTLVPGPTDSELIGQLAEQFAGQLGVSTTDFKHEFITSGSHANLARRFARTEEVAAMATYLCSEAASATTGSPVRVDGGAVRSAF